MDYLQAYEKRIGCTIDELVNNLKEIIDCLEISYFISARVKDIISLQDKLLFKRTNNVFLLKDVYGIRILVEKEEDAYKILSLISKKISGYLKNDYIASPKTREDTAGLKGKKLRFIQYIAKRNNIFYEIQITTENFHYLNEELHSGYKENKYT